MKKLILILPFFFLIATSLAQSVGIGTPSPEESAVLDLSSTSKGFLAPRMTEAQRDGITPVEGLMIWNTTTKRPNYYDGTEWKNFDGFSAQNLAVGDSYQGGIIFYLLQPGDPGYVIGQKHGLIAASVDQSTGAIWGCTGTALNGADGTAIGTGVKNTIDIVAGCATVGIAARLCSDLDLNGYSDWYLPSKDEMYLLYLNRAAVGGFTTDVYPSSSEYSGSPTNNIWGVNFALGSLDCCHGKSVATHNVRAIRSF